MKTLWTLLWKDLLRDARNPWVPLLLASIPVILGGLVGYIFAGGGGGGEPVMPVVRIAVWDQDESLFSGMAFSGMGQGDLNNNLRVTTVGSVNEGLRILERRKASAFIILPEGLTDAVIHGATAEIVIYENPAEQLLPRVVTQGAQLLAVGASAASELLGTPLRHFHDLIEADRIPEDFQVSALAVEVNSHIRRFDTYLFPPIIQYRRIKADDYTVSLQPIETGEDSL